jgi:DNA-binding response OmpR family regulator
MTGNGRGQEHMWRIAIVDDDRDFLTLMTDALADRGWEVRTCSDILSALEFLRDERPDVAIVDVRMDTAESGWELCDFLQLHPATAHVQIIVCSAATDILRVRAQWLADRAIGVLEKPFDIDKMYAVVDAAMRRAGYPTSDGRAISSA